MGSPTPETPGSLSPAAPGPAVRVSSVMAGQEWIDPNGSQHLAAADGVLVELLCTETSHPVAVLLQSPDSAISLARLIQDAAVKLINAEVNDNGEKLSVFERLSRVTAAHTGVHA